MNKRLAALSEVLPTLVRDAAGLAGVGLLSYGAWLAWPPAGFMVAGALILAGVVLSARAR